MSMSGVIRQLVVKITAEVQNSSFMVMEDRLTNVRSIMSSIGNIVNKIKDQVMTFVEAGAGIESMTLKFGTLAKSMELGTAKLKELNYFAATTPFTLPDVRKNTSMLMAMGIELKDVIPTMTMLGNITSGLPNLSLERLALNFGQVKSQTYLTGRELRDFAVGGIPLLAGLQESLGKSALAIREMISKKQISFTMVEDAFKKMVSSEGRFHNMLAKMAKSTEGLYNNIKVTWQLIKEGVGAQLVEIVRPLLAAVKDFMYENRAKLISMLTRAIKSLLKVMIAVYRIIFKLGVVLIPILSVVSEVIGTFVDWTTAVIEFTAEWVDFVLKLEPTLPILKGLAYVLFTVAAGFAAIQIVGLINMLTGGAGAFAAMGMFVAFLSKGLVVATAALAKFAWTALMAMLPFLLTGILITGLILLVQDFYETIDAINNNRPTETLLFYGLDLLKEKLGWTNEEAGNLLKTIELLMIPMTSFITLIKALFAEGDFVENFMNDENMKSAYKRFNTVLEQFKIAFKVFGEWLGNYWGDVLDNMMASFRKAMLKIFEKISEIPIIGSSPLVAGIAHALKKFHEDGLTRSNHNPEKISNRRALTQDDVGLNTVLRQNTEVTTDNSTRTSYETNYYQGVPDEKMQKIMQRAGDNIDSALIDAQGASN